MWPMAVQEDKEEKMAVLQGQIDTFRDGAEALEQEFQQVRARPMWGPLRIALTP